MQFGGYKKKYFLFPGKHSQTHGLFFYKYLYMQIFKKFCFLMCIEKQNTLRRDYIFNIGM